MKTSTSQITDFNKYKYGILIKPSVFCKVINIQLHEEMFLSPEIQYYLPWNEDYIEIYPAEPITTMNHDKTSFTRNIENETFQWLKLSEKSFKFWDNDIDEAWNNV